MGISEKMKADFTPDIDDPPKIQDIIVQTIAHVRYKDNEKSSRCRNGTYPENNKKAILSHYKKFRRRPYHSKKFI